MRELQIWELLGNQGQIMLKIQVVHQDIWLQK